MALFRGKWAEGRQMINRIAFHAMTFDATERKAPPAALSSRSCIACHFQRPSRSYSGKIRDGRGLSENCQQLHKSCGKGAKQKEPSFSTPRQDISPPYLISREFLATLAVSSSLPSFSSTTTHYSDLCAKRSGINILPTGMEPILDGHWPAWPAGRLLQDNA
jgi:hypothetical protein